MPVTVAESEVTGPVGDAVSGVEEPDNELLTPETGMTEDGLDVSGTGTTVVGMIEETPRLDKTDGRSDETPEASVPEIGTVGGG